MASWVPFAGLRRAVRRRARRSPVLRRVLGHTPLNRPGPLRRPEPGLDAPVGPNANCSAPGELRVPVTWVSPLGLPPFPEPGSIGLGEIFGSEPAEVPLSDELLGQLGRARRYSFATVDGDDDPDPVLGARALMVALSGLPVAHGGSALLAGLHPDLLRSMVVDRHQLEAEDEQKRVSLEQRRAALLNHAHHRPGTELSVTALTASRRPEMFDRLVDQVAAQRHVDVELVVGAHGWEPDRDALDRARSQLPGGLKVVTIDRSESLGSVLNRLLDVAEGRFVSKWDDDDLYGPHHLVDLLLAWSYSGADVVGKGAEHVYLSRRDVTLRRYWGGAESFSPTVSGATLTLELDRLRGLGGFDPSRARGEDTALVQRVTESGGSVYRTHGFEFVAMRSGDSTWPIDEHRLIAQSDDVRPGLDTEFAGWW